ncbi:MAG: hypothetical protein Q7T75_02510, partial [Mesorhizobium sp.]|nr:hypothetical protein [Mesorhizobium sp.]
DAGATAINWRPSPAIGAAELIGTLSAIADAGADKIMLQDFDIAGPGLPVEAILEAHRQVRAFSSIKVETSDNLDKSRQHRRRRDAPDQSLRRLAGDRDDRVVRCRHSRLHADRPRAASAAYLSPAS